jgi:hypothetical protein
MSLQTGKADPLLLLPREAPYILADVLEKWVHGCRDEIVLSLGDSFIRFVVDNETDTIMSEFKPSPFRGKKRYVSIRSATPWKAHVGKECGWTWFGWNQQGYLDTVLISFDGIVPSILLQTIASSIKVFTISPAENAVALPTSRGGKQKANGKQ